MTRVFPLGRSIVWVLAAVFAAVPIVYGGAWMYYVRLQTATAEFGFTAEFVSTSDAAVVGSVEAGSPAARAGLRTGDRIREVNAQRLDTRDRFLRWERERAGEEAILVVERSGTSSPVRLLARLPEGVPFSLTRLVRASLLEALTFYPVVFVGVGLAVLAARPHNPYAWLMAALFASFLTVPQFPRATSGLPPRLGAFVLAYRAIALPAIPALFYGFFALFPARSPMDRRLPWLKWLNGAGWMLFALPNLRIGAPASPAFLDDWIGRAWADGLRYGYLFAGIPMGIAALTWNAARALTADARRKARVLLWGTVVGALPIVVESALQLFAGWSPPGWVSTGAVMVASVFPASFAYAVVKHQVLDVPVLLKRSARYVLVRRGFGVLLLALAASLTGVLAVALSRVFLVDVTVATAAGVTFGVAMAVGFAPLVRRTTQRIDRAFFRSAYDATAILEGLAEDIRLATDRAGLARLLEERISEALHPLAIAVFLEGHDGQLHPFASRWPSALPVLSVDLPWLLELARRGRPWDVSSTSKEEPPAFLRVSQAECLVPVLGRAGRSGRLIGCLILGPRASEEPYSGDDRRLLASVTAQAGVELDNIGLAESMAERLDAQRTADREMEIARQVQARLFPQKQPALRTLDYAGGCLQARRVGGDYFDFLPLAPDRLGLVVADISGKGIAGALLMANLQASLRGQSLLAANDLPRLLSSVNQLFYDNTADNQYATLFFADYCDTTRRLRYANCGHFPPYLLHADGTAEPLMPTAMVLGLFESWTVDIVERTLAEGDTVVIYTDGVIEAASQTDDEFGVERLLHVVRRGGAGPAATVVASVHAAVQAFCHGLPSDDLTVVIARVR